MMNPVPKFYISIVLGALILLSVSACNNHGPKDPGTALARVGNQYLTLEEARKAIPDFMYQRDSTAALTQYREQWIQEQLVLLQANKLNLQQHPSIREKLKQARKEILREAVRKQVMITQVDTTITDEEARTYFENHKEHFILTEPYVQFRHLALKEIADARAAQLALGGGTPWKEVVQKYAPNPDEAQRRARRYWPLSLALKDIEVMHNYLQSLEVGEVSAIQRVNGLYHFVQLTGRRPKGAHPDLTWIMSEVKNWIVRDKRQRKFSSYLKNLYLKAKSDNEIETFNVLPTQANVKKSTPDTLERNSLHE